MSQPVFDPTPAVELLDRYAENSGERLSAPVFFGVQVMTGDGPVFGDVPEWVTDGLAKGRTGADIALEVLDRFTEAGFPGVLSHSADSEGREARLRGSTGGAGRPRRRWVGGMV